MKTKKEDKFDKHRASIGANKVDAFLAAFGLGPKYKPTESKKYKCPKCSKVEAYYREIHEDTDMDEIVLYCPNCKEEFTEEEI